MNTVTNATTPSLTITNRYDLSIIIRVSACAANDPTRWQLCGTYVGPVKGKHGTFAVATDGKRIAIGQLETKLPGDGVTVPADAIKALGKCFSFRKQTGHSPKSLCKPYMGFVPEPGHNETSVYVSDGNSESCFTAPDCVFPDISTVFPVVPLVRAVSASEAFVLDATLLAGVGRILNRTEGPNTGEYYREDGKNGPVFVFNEDIIFGAMPMATTGKSKHGKTWVLQDWFTSEKATNGKAIA
jgi:hypothetical protein